MVLPTRLALLLPALALAGCCCERPCAPPCGPSSGPTIVCPSPAPAPAAEPPRVSVGAGIRVQVPASPAPLPMDAAAPSKLTVYDVRDLVAASYFNAKLLEELRPVLPADAQAFIRGDSVIVVKTTPAGQAAAKAWLDERRKAVTPVMMAVDVADLTATTPIDTLVERLREALPAGTGVNRQGTVTLIVKGTPAVHAQVGALLAELRMAASPPK